MECPRTHWMHTRNWHLIWNEFSWFKDYSNADESKKLYSWDKQTFKARTDCKHTTGKQTQWDVKLVMAVSLNPHYKKNVLKHLCCKKQTLHVACFHVGTWNILKPALLDYRNLFESVDLFDVNSCLSWCIKKKKWNTWLIMVAWMPRPVCLSGHAKA